MPNWKTHLEVANRLNKKLNFSGYDLELFLIGNILPDINNGYIVKDVSTIISHDRTHFKEDNYYLHKNFMKYYDFRNNPLLLGYFCHLYTDYSFNNNFYSNLKDNMKTLTSDELRVLKQNDFKAFNNNFNHNIEISDIDKIVTDIRIIDRISINKEDIIKVYDFLNNQGKYNNIYNYYSDKELYILLNNTINELDNIINN